MRNGCRQLNLLMHAFSCNPIGHWLCWVQGPIADFFGSYIEQSLLSGMHVIGLRVRLFLSTIRFVAIYLLVLTRWHTLQFFLCCMLLNISVRCKDAFLSLFCTTPFSRVEAIQAIDNEVSHQKVTYLLFALDLVRLKCDVQNGPKVAVREI